MAPIHFTPSRPKRGIIGHRGLAALAPENTLSSFTLAAQEGIDWIEFDLQLTSDHALVIFHDDTLNRTTNGQGLVHQHTLSELIALDAGSWFHSDYQDEKIPVFKDILPQLHSLNLHLNIELKLPAYPTTAHVNQLAIQLIQLLQNTWPKEKALPLVSSFYWPILHLIRALSPSIPIGFLTEEGTQEMLYVIAKYPNAACHMHYLSLTKEILTLAQSLSVPLLAYTVNDKEIALKLLNAGVFAVFSDHPL